MSVTEDVARLPFELEPFRQMTERGEPWNKRVEAVRTAFPSVTELDWKRAFDDEPELLGRILKDILKAMQATPGRPGPRPAIDKERAQPVVDHWMGNDPGRRPYTVVPFPQALRVLIRPATIRAAAARLEMSKERVWRLLAGTAQPTIAEMEWIAETYEKRPSYFVEYRIHWAVSALVCTLEAAPEQSIRVYESLQQAVG